MNIKQEQQTRSLVIMLQVVLFLSMRIWWLNIGTQFLFLFKSSPTPTHIPKYKKQIYRKNIKLITKKQTTTKATTKKAT